ncbi:hypothetical protein ACFXJ5_07865 [Streptomyces sp. NPDC059373]
MRIRATVAALSGALVLSALALPAAAQASERPGAEPLNTFSSKAVHADTAAGDTTFSNVVVNGGKDIVLGLTTKKTVTVSWTATDTDGVADSWAALWHGTDMDNMDGALVPTADTATCTVSATDATVSACKISISIDASTDLYKNGAAGTWKLYIDADDSAGNGSYNDTATTVQVKKISKLTVNATPEPVKKGKTITVTGKLSRANWTTNSYTGYSTQPVKLQYRKKDSSTYTTLKTIKSSSTGALKTTTTATADGFYRFSFAGTSTTATTNATGGYVDVQ